ncbi:MAG: orotidine 5'-phosphate decarboxylase / HUMPS family protein [Metallosphaera yellowstonensis]|jgi:orotidine-5'-phosphate decarboxylase (EC 4.1.1.23)
MSRVILSLDVPMDRERLKELSHHLAGVKVGWPLLLDLGPSKVSELTKGLGLKVILDLKLADIDSTMVSIASKLKSLGDGFIAHSFVGIDGALDSLRRELKDRELYLVISMSHPGWSDEVYQYLLQVTKGVNPEGLVAPATRQSVVRRARADFPDKIIISPGVGAQGARPGSALCAGADFEIVGRSVYLSHSPLDSLLKIVKEQEVAINECKGGMARET